MRLSAEETVNGRGEDVGDEKEGNAGKGSAVDCGPISS